MAIGAAYAKGKWALGECARSGRKMLLRDMIADGYYPNLIVDPEWYEPKHPQESLPSVRDPTALYRPAPERDQIGTLLELGGAPGLDPIPGGGFGLPLGGAGSAGLSFGYELANITPVIESGAVRVKDSGFEIVDNSLTFNLDLTGSLDVGCSAIVHMISITTNAELDSSGPDLRCIISNHVTSKGYNDSVRSGSLWWFPRENIVDATIFALTSNNATNVRWYVLWWVVQNLNLACPFQNLSWSDPGIDDDITANVDFVALMGAPQISSPNSSVLEIVTFHDGPTAGDPVITRKTPTQDVVTNMQIDENSGSGKSGWLYAAFYNPGAVSLCENLLPDTANDLFATWSTSGSSSLDPVLNGIHYAVVIDDGDITGGPHGCFKDVTLEVGETYCLAVHWDVVDEQAWFIGWEELASPGINGQFFRGETTASLPIIDQVTNQGVGWNEVFHCVSLEFANNDSANSFFFLTPANSGTYRIWFASPSDNDTTLASLIYDSSLSVRTFTYNIATLSKGDFVPPFIPSLGFAVPPPTVPPGFLPRTLMRLNNNPARAWGGLPIKGMTVELCGNIITAPELIRHQEQMYAHVFPDDNHFGSGNDYPEMPFQGGNSSVGHMMGRLAFPAGDATGATGKYYCEFTVGASFGTPNAITLGVYVGTFNAHISGGQSNAASDPGDEAGERPFIASYMADGQTHHNGITTNGLLAYTTGDVIGIALDLVTGEVTWSRNGTPARVETLIGDFLNTTTGAPIPAYVGSVNCNNKGFKVRWTMKAPFAFTKPVGFQDWDYLS